NDMIELETAPRRENAGKVRFDPALHLLQAAITKQRGNAAILGSIESLALSISKVFDSKKEDGLIKMIEGHVEPKELEKILHENGSSHEKTLLLCNQLVKNVFIKINEKKQNEQTE